VQNDRELARDSDLGLAELQNLTVEIADLLFDGLAAPRSAA
jgi:hypothetical protein